MNKIRTFLSLSMALYGASSFAGAMGSVDHIKWTGFYVGGNAGYLWSANDSVHTDGVYPVGNPVFAPNSRVVAASLALLGTNEAANSASGFMAGAQLGYNSQISDYLLIGIDADIDGVFNASKSSYMFRSVATPPLGTHSADVSVTKKLDYLGLLKGRLGVLPTPSVFLYGAGGFAYGAGKLNTNYAVNSTNPFFLPINSFSEKSEILGGWTAGGGVEWMFAPCWSMKFEYLYYYLGPLHTDLTLSQNLTLLPNTAYASSLVETHTKFTENTVRLGLNYYFT